MNEQDNRNENISKHSGIKIPESFKDSFKPTDIKFVVDEFEDIIMMDILQNDLTTLKKLKRDVTDTFLNWIDTKIKQKENISLNVKGETRSGKSLIALKVSDLVTKKYKDKCFDTEKIVCANQKEYRIKLKDSDFGDIYQIDENAFSNVGIGSISELQQLKDVQNIIAKKNVHTIYITPRTFLNTNSRLGLSFYGKDINNWVSRFLLYDLRGQIPILLGFVMVNVGTLFTDYGCYVYKETGGCTNPKKKEFKHIPSDNIKYSNCISKDYKEKDLDNSKQNCPFYNVCNHPLNKYEKKKDTWIDKEMKGGLDERTLERYETALQLFFLLVEWKLNSEGNKSLGVKAKNKKEMLVKLKMKIPTISNTQFTGTEIDEIATLIFSLIDYDFFKDICKNLNKNPKFEWSKIKINT